MKKDLIFFRLACVLFAFVSLSAKAQNTAPYWSLAGNNGTTAAATSKLGTTTALPLNLTTNNLTRLRIEANGRVGIGTTAPALSFTPMALELLATR
jgi:hypothetical protein